MTFRLFLLEIHLLNCNRAKSSRISFRVLLIFYVSALNFANRLKSPSPNSFIKKYPNPVLTIVETSLCTVIVKNICYSYLNYLHSNVDFSLIDHFFCIKLMTFLSQASFLQSHQWVTQPTKYIRDKNFTPNYKRNTALFWCVSATTWAFGEFLSEFHIHCILYSYKLLKL